MKNRVDLIGRLGNDPETRTVGDSNVVRFRLATFERWTDKKTGEKQERTEWHSVECWGRKADFVAQFCGKGDLVSVEGKIEYREADDGRRYTDIRAHDVIRLTPKSN